MSDDRIAAARRGQRAADQVTALAGMIQARERFTDVAQQLPAARGSLDSLLARLVELGAQDGLPTGSTREEADGLLRTALGRMAPARRAGRPQQSRTTERSAVRRQERTHP